MLREAGEALAPRAPAGAARWFRTALDLLPDGAPATERLGLWTALAGAEHACGNLVAAHAALLRCLDLVPPDAATRVRFTAYCAGVENVLGHHDTAHRRLETALDDLPGGPSPEAVTLLVELARDGIHRLEFGSLHQWSRRALAAARPLGDRTLLARSCAGAAFSAAYSGAVGEAAAACAEAAALVDGLSDEELGRFPDPVAMHLAAAELFLDRLGDADRHAERALAIARTAGRDHLLPLLFWAGTVRTARGRLPDAAAIFDDAIEIARMSGNASMLAWNLFGRSATAVAEGDHDLACVTAEESVAVLRGSPPVLVSVWASLALAAALAEAGDPDRAARVLTDAVGGAELPLLPPPLRPAGFALLTRCRLTAGRRGEAADAVAAVAACAAGSGLPTARATAEHAAAELALDDDPAAAAEHALCAAELAGSTGAVVAAALSRVLAGRALAAAGETTQATTELQQAAAALRCLRRGAAVRRGGARAAPARPPAAAPAHPPRRPGRRRAGHTDRPRAAGRPADRGPQDELADRGRAVLAPKTVETHVRNLFSKLDVSSRVEIARMVEHADRGVG